jgi:hypothetical protein
LLVELANFGSYRPDLEFFRYPNTLSELMQATNEEMSKAAIVVGYIRKHFSSTFGCQRS